MKEVLRKFGPTRWLARRTRGLRARLRRSVPTISTVARRRARVQGAPSGPRSAAPEGRRFRDDLALARVEWRDVGPTEYLRDRARSLMENTIAWRILPPEMWLVFGAVLNESGDRERAARLLRTYARHGLPVDLIARCLPLAQLARDEGLGTDRVLRAAQAADALQRVSVSDSLSALVAGRTVAVVGNGPGNLGSGRGAEIDSHDVVIRFNNHPESHAEDYGTRTDIWVRGAHRDVRDRVEIDGFALVIWEMDPFRNLLEAPSHSDILHRDTLVAPGRITHIDSATKARLRARSELLLPTSGAQLLWLLSEVRGSLEGVDVYGFSTLDGSGDHGHYFDSLGDMASRHDVEGEARFLRQLLTAHLSQREAGDDTHPEREREGATTVFSCAYRDYDPAAGKTGGPGGVLATQRHALGDHHGDASLEYVFRGEDPAALRRRLAATTAGLSTKVAEIIVASEHIATHPRIREARDSGSVLLVCHELGSAYGAYRLGVPYVLVYHQQGSTLQEMRSIGRQPTPRETHVASVLEKLVCDNARAVYFPSLGARDAYLRSSDGEVSGDNFASWALYNTVSAVDHVDGELRPTVRDVVTELGLPERDEDTDVFISVGDFNEDKGLDRVPALLTRYTELTGRAVTWIAIGAASDPERFAALQRERRQWPFRAHLFGERTTHARLLALLEYADYYVMMHRTSIFDLATLEAMRAGKALILSPVGGNLEVDLAGNVLFVEEDTILDACRVLQTRDKRMWGERNRTVFEEHFSLDRFAQRYRRMLDAHVGPDGGSRATASTPERTAV